MTGWFRIIALIVFLAALFAPQFALAVSIEIDDTHPIRTLRPRSVLGSTVDKEPAGTIPSLYSPKNVREMLAAGWGWLSYRLFTELSVQDWHWNPQGTFSAGDSGYWVSSASTKNPAVADSFGYRLPRRGSTSDQGKNEEYSRLDDGDAKTYWKSNPYLSSRYTGESDALHRQWVVIDLEKLQPVDTMYIQWGAPYATHFLIQYWTGSDAIGDPAHGDWRTFEFGDARYNGAAILRKLGNRPVSTRFLRLLLLTSSGSCPYQAKQDPRNCAGYAIREISVGIQRAYVNGRPYDYVRHLRCGGLTNDSQPCGDRQTPMYVSSTDPWHERANRVQNQEQPGLDMIARSGLTRGMPAMYPVPMLYSTPENAVAEIRYLKARGYAIGGIELGEEPDGQYILPEDYGALYVQWARALHRLDPKLKFGGPVFSGVNDDLPVWSDTHGNTSWMSRFIAYLRNHQALKYLDFVSFEHYPYEGCEHGAKLLSDLVAEPDLIARMPRIWRRDGVPKNVPLYVTEANFTWVNFSQTPMQIEGALWQADYMASAISNGIEAVVYYQYEPVPLSQNTRCPSDWGNLTMFVADRSATIRARAAQFWAGRMLTGEWFLPGNQKHTLYRAAVVMDNPHYLSAYALKRPDGVWSVMVVNKDSRAYDVSVRLAKGRPLRARVTRVAFGSGQYVWRQNGASSGPVTNTGPAVAQVSGPEYRIPAQSITVLRWKP